MSLSAHTYSQAPSLSLIVGYSRSCASLYTTNNQSIAGILFGQPFNIFHLDWMFLALVVVLFIETQPIAAAKPPALFIFGDSTADVGTNTYLANSHARADFPFYGIDFPHSKPSVYVLQALYGLGARKFGIISVPPIGCCPSQRLHAAGNCFEAMNDFATCFYSSVDSLFRKLSTQLQGMKYALGNTFVTTASNTSSGIYSTRHKLLLSWQHLLSSLAVLSSLAQ